MSKTKTKVLLLEDVDHTGRKGSVVEVKAGFFRNYLMPQKKGAFASKEVLKMQARLQEERKMQADKDRKESLEVAKKIEGKTLSIEVKLDPEGHMYGSVSSQDIGHLLEKEGVIVEKKAIRIPHPIKKVGEHKISLHLKEDVLAPFLLVIKGEGVKEEEETKKASEEKIEEEIQEKEGE